MDVHGFSPMQVIIIQSLGEKDECDVIKLLDQTTEPANNSTFHGEPFKKM